jgi:hypothetical protein
MENLKARFMLQLVADLSYPECWHDEDRTVAELSALADKLVAVCTPSAHATPADSDALDERDHGVLAALVEMMPSYQRGALSSHWKALCEHKGVCARRGWETSSQRLLRAGKVRLVGGRRWFVEVANNPAI